MNTVDQRRPERFRHKKRGTTYAVIGTATVQASGAPIAEAELVVVYRAESDGALWVRRQSEFHDGRFELLQPEGQTVPPGTPVISNEQIAVLCAIGEGASLRTDQMDDVAELLANGLVEASGEAEPENLKLTAQGQQVISERGTDPNKG